MTSNVGGARADSIINLDHSNKLNKMLKREKDVATSRNNLVIDIFFKDSFFVFLSFGK